MANFVQVFKSTDTNAPTLSGTAGDLITLLNKCLVDGYTTASLTSISRKGTGNLTALALMGSANTTLYSGTYITVTGCSGTGATQYNVTAPIKFHVAWQASTTYAQGALVDNGTNTYLCTVGGQSAGSGGPTGTGTGIIDNAATWDYVDAAANAGKYFSYQVASDPGANASGSPVYAKAGLQWTRPFAAGTNSQTYRSADTSSNQFYLQVIDNAATAGGALEAQVYGAEVMAADQSVTSGRFPTTAQATNGLCCRKSVAANATTRTWFLFGDDRTFYLVITTGDVQGTNIASRHGFGFGYFPSYKAGDSFNTFALGGLTFNTANSAIFVVSPVGCGVGNGNCYMPRAYTQIGSSISGSMVVFAGNNGASGSQNATTPGGTAQSGSSGSLVTYPNPSDSGLFVQPIFITDTNAFPASIRGRVPGFFGPLHANPFTEGDESTGVNGLSGVTLVAISAAGTGTNGVGQLLVDKFGPWA